jgi:hypothetical protein
MVDGRCVYQHREQLVAIIDLREPRLQDDRRPLKVRSSSKGASIAPSRRQTIAAW